MDCNIKNNKMAQALSHHTLFRFLEDEGFSRAYQYRNGAVLYKHLQHNEEVIVPTDRSFSDYYEKLGRAVAILSNYLELDLGSTYSKILHVDSDIIKIRITGPETQDGSLPINPWVSLANSIHKWIISGASFTFNPKLYHAKLRTKETDHLVQRCKIGQTEFGSYVTNIIFPLENISQEQLSLIEGVAIIPPTRRVTTTLIRSSSNLIAAIESHKLEDILTQEKPIVSANLCESLLDMYNSTPGSSFLINANWSPTRKIDDQSLLESIEFKSEYKKTISDIHRALTPSVSSSEVSLSGFVILLNRDQTQEEEHGEIVLLTQKGSRVLRVHIQLPPDQYLSAIDAHKSNRPILISGSLNKISNKYHLTEVKNFKLLS